MCTRRSATVLAALLLLAFAQPARSVRAQVPSPLNSTVPLVLVGSPDGTVTSTVIVRDIANNPIQVVLVDLDFTACPAWHACPMVCTACAVFPSGAGNVVERPTNLLGTASFDLRLGASGCPSPPTVRVYATGILLGSPTFASLDQDGDLSVTPADVAIVHALIGSGDRHADFDGDGQVTAADEALVFAHVGGSCAGPVPARHATWGALKTIYR